MYPDPYTIIAHRWPLVAIEVMTGVQEEVWGRSIKRDKVHIKGRGGMEGVMDGSNSYPRCCCSCPVWNQKSMSIYLALAHVTYLTKVLFLTKPWSFPEPNLVLTSKPNCFHFTMLTYWRLRSSMAFAGTLDYDPVRAVLRVVGESFAVVLSRLDMRTSFYLSLSDTHCPKNTPQQIH